MERFGESFQGHRGDDLVAHNLFRDAGGESGVCFLEISDTQTLASRKRPIHCRHRSGAAFVSLVTRRAFSAPVRAIVDLGSRHRADTGFDGGAHLWAVVFLCMGLRHLGAVRINVMGAPCRKPPSVHSLVFLCLDDPLTARLLAAQPRRLPLGDSVPAGISAAEYRRI